MKSITQHITQQFRFPTSVKILVGCPVVLVGKRQMVGKYETNNEIKYWATWHLLKSLTGSGCIKEWLRQKEILLHWLRMSEGTFRRQLSWLVEHRLVTVDKSTRSIRLVSYTTAAELLGIEYQGVYSINYNHNKCYGKQNFQFILITEEFKHHQRRQASAIMRKLDENPKYREDLIILLQKEGCDLNRLQTDPYYFIERLLQLQIRYFKEGSAITAYVFTLRADTNRGVKKIQQHHGYKSAQSVSYLKRRMSHCGVIQVNKICTVSNSRNRLFIPDLENGGTREGHKWLKAKKRTALFLCDQVTATYKTDLETLTVRKL